MRRAKSKITTPDFRTADFGLFRDLLGRIPWDNAMEREGGPRKLVNTRASPPSSSGAVHPNEQEVRQKCQDACMDE